MVKLETKPTPSLVEHLLDGLEPRPTEPCLTFMKVEQSRRLGLHRYPALLFNFQLVHKLWVVQVYDGCE